MMNISGINQYWILLLLPFLVQATAIIFDEFYFHHQRGLGLWERIGHPLDTFTVLVPYMFCLYFAVTPTNMIGFILLTVFSCVFVTKDEFVHKELCTAPEQWLHAILFLFHGLAFISLGLIWILIDSAGINQAANVGPLHFTWQQFLLGQTIILSTFCIYQIIFWNWEHLWNRQKKTV